MAASDRFRTLPSELLLELFVAANLGFLTLDIYLAHSTNSFRERAEYIPLYFSACAPIVLLFGLRYRESRIWRIAGYAVALMSIAVGLAGVVFHLDSSFFYEKTLKSLTYSAPFAAPLAYAGLGFLLLLNRMVESSSAEWAAWVMFFALGGFAGNFVLSLGDHATNGFYYSTEWVPVAMSAVAVGFLFTAVFLSPGRRFLQLCGGVMVFAAAVGIWGFALHAKANLVGPSIHAFANFVHGAPPFAPLLFPNLAILGLLGIYSGLAQANQLANKKRIW